MAHSKARRVSPKPAKDWRRSWQLNPDSPLFPLPATVEPGTPDHRRWAKKVNRKLEYFGKVANVPKGQTALAE